jgi:hypothetical protein
MAVATDPRRLHPRMKDLEQRVATRDVLPRRPTPNVVSPVQRMAMKPTPRHLVATMGPPGSDCWRMAREPAQATPSFHRARAEPIFLAHGTKEPAQAKPI